MFAPGKAIPISGHSAAPNLSNRVALLVLGGPLEAGIGRNAGGCFVAEVQR